MEAICIEIFRTIGTMLMWAAAAFSTDGVNTHNPAAVGTDFNPNSFGDYAMSVSEYGQAVMWAILGFVFFALMM